MTGSARRKPGCRARRRDGSPMFAPQRPAMVIDRARYVGDTVVMVIAETTGAGKGRGGTGGRAVRAAAVGHVACRSRQAGCARACGTRTRTTFPIPTSAATGPRPTPPLPKPRTWCVAATSSPASTRSTWSRGARSAPMIAGEDRYTLYADVNYPHRVRDMLANIVFKVPESKVRVVVERCRRRFRRQGLAIRRSPPGAVGGQETRPAGEVEVRALRGAARRRARARQHRRHRAGARRERQIPRPPPAHAGQHRRLHRLRPPASHAVRPDFHGNGRLRHPGRTREHRRGAVEHQPHRALSRRRTAGSGLSDRAHHRGGGAGTRHRPRSNCGDATSSRRKNCRTKAPLGPLYDCGEFEKNMDLALQAADYAGYPARLEASRASGKLRGIAVVNAIEQAAGPTPEYAEIRFNPSGTAIMMLGTKTHGQGHETVVQADPARAARHRPERRAVHRRRHRPGRVRHGLERLALDGDRRRGADDWPPTR